MKKRNLFLVCLLASVLLSGCSSSSSNGNSKKEKTDSSDKEIQTFNIEDVSTSKFDASKFNREIVMAEIYSIKRNDDCLILNADFTEEDLRNPSLHFMAIGNDEVLVDDIMSEKIKSRGSNSYYLTYDNNDGNMGLSFILNIYNVNKDTEITASECIKNGWWMFTDTTSFDTTQYLSNAKKTGYSIEESLFGLIDTLGHPSSIYRNYDSDDELNDYYLCYEYDELTIVAIVNDVTTYSDNKSKEIEVKSVRQTMIYGKEYWDSEQDWYSEYMEKQ